MIAGGIGAARALLIGTGRHAAGSRLADVPAVTATMADLRRVLRDRCGISDDAIRVEIDPPTVIEMGEAVAAAAEAARDSEPLLVYYVGHGLVGANGGLYLAAAGTDARES